MNCYCEHPNTSHFVKKAEVDNSRYGYHLKSVFGSGKCVHCNCLKFIEKPEKERASEDICPNNGKFNCICPQCYKEASKECCDDCSERGREVELHICVCHAKPQEEQKWNTDKSARDIQRETLYPNQKESESREESPVDIMTEVLGQRLKEIHESNIILPCPSGMSVGEAIYGFYRWYDYKRDRSIVEAACGGADELENLEVMSDQDFLTLWNEWYQSVKK